MSINYSGPCHQRGHHAIQTPLPNTLALLKFGVASCGWHFRDRKQTLIWTIAIHMKPAIYIWRISLSSAAFEVRNAPTNFRLQKHETSPRGVLR